jgi:uncharacterized glyoxalase superfamily protein PhnB
VSRLLAVSDIARSVAFYRDVLGFKDRMIEETDGVATAAEVASGPAVIRIEVGDRAPDSTFEYRPRGSAILYFQTDDVAAMHAQVLARGGAPTDMQKVNWLKMRMFEIQDPDGHTLWFGQSFQEPSLAPSPDRMLRRIMPRLPLDDVPAGVAYYRDVLGFSINYQQHDLGVMDRDDVELLLIARTTKHRGIGSASVYVTDADALYAELKARGANLQGEPVSRPWGLRDFSVVDPEGNEITFAQPFE